MDPKMMIEILGYIGSVLVVVSMLMASVVRLRLVNTVGSVVSATYALIIHSYPLALMNICLIIINIYNLTKLLKSEKHYDLIDVKQNDAFLAYFMEHYKSDIREFFPDAERDAKSADAAYMICCDALPAGMLLGKKMKDGKLEILLDYTTPAYRDCSAGVFLYAKLAGKGIRQLVYSGKSQKHVPYLLKMGFAAKDGTYVKQL